MYQFPVEAKSTTQCNPSQTMDRSQRTHKATTNRPCRRDQNPPGEQSINASDTGGGVPEEYNGLHHGHPWFFRIFSDKTHVRHRISAVPGDSMWGCGGSANSKELGAEQKDLLSGLGRAFQPLHKTQAAI
jgi:hypothetical protein